MKVQWDEDDVRPGRVVSASEGGERMMLGYNPSLGLNDARWHLVSLRDGMVGQPACTQEGMARLLTEQGMVPIEALAWHKYRVKVEP